MSGLWTPPSSEQNRENAVLSAMSKGRKSGESPEIAEMRLNRRVAQKKSGVSNDLRFATGRPRDPMFYWRENNLPYDVNDPDKLKELREYARLLYMTHPVIASAIDIFSKYPITGAEFVSKDSALTEFYTELFFDELDYEDYLTDIGREYWTVGEAWPLGTFSELLGVWEDDELINADDVEVIRSPFLKEPRFEMRLPESIRDIIQNREPAWEYQQLVANYPELVNFAHQQDAHMPVSNVLLKQLKFKGDTFNSRGVPILMRGFRAIMQEEMLNAAQDAIASRMYTPLILAKLGASANELGTSQPWIPTDGDIADFQEAVDMALAGDFRMLTYHFGVQMSSVFGRESMPRFNDDFDRLTDRILQVFGLSKTMLSGASSGQTYAADALNRDLITQLLSTYQRILKRFVRERMLVVAEAQEHYDYESRGGKRYPIMEEVLVVDEESGEQRIVEQPKLLVPEMRIRAMNMRDENSYRQFIEAIRNSGVPISMKTRLINVPVDLDDEIEQVREEQIQVAVDAQVTRKETYEALVKEGLPVPDDLLRDFGPKAGADAAEDQRLPNMTEPPADTEALTPTFDQTFSTDPRRRNVQTLPRNRARPEESDEARADMPKASVKEVEVDAEGDDKVVRLAYVDPDGKPVGGRLQRGPSTVGARRAAKLDPKVPLEEQVSQ